MNRVYNFSAGPATLPEAALKKAQEELFVHGSSGMSVMEMSHRSKAFEDIINKTESDLREIMNIPDNYKVLFLQGGASLQFAMAPLNLMTENKTADFIDSGVWTTKAMAEAKKFIDVNVVASSKDDTYSYVPKVENKDFNKDADYIYMCSNNTIYGTKANQVPEVEGVPVVADMSSCILSEEIDVSKYGIIFAGAQKNMGPAGVTVVIIREDLIGNAADNVPAMLNYEIQANGASMYNTPPTYAIYMLGLVYQWVKDQGGVKGLEKVNNQKADLLYDFIDDSKLFKGTTSKEDRSIMNVTFVTGDEELDALFVEQATKEGLENLKGHRSVGGMRASIYNAMTLKGVETLVDFMKRFEANNG